MNRLYFILMLLLVDSGIGMYFNSLTMFEFIVNFTIFYTLSILAIDIKEGNRL